MNTTNANLKKNNNHKKNDDKTENSTLTITFFIHTHKKNTIVFHLLIDAIQSYDVRALCRICFD